MDPADKYVYYLIKQIKTKTNVDVLAWNMVGSKLIVVVASVNEEFEKLAKKLEFDFEIK